VKVRLVIEHQHPLVGQREKALPYFFDFSEFRKVSVILGALMAQFCRQQLEQWNRDGDFKSLIMSLLHVIYWALTRLG
jgi:hypothetical protein